MKRCELCRNPATIHCEADGASLCSNCDEKVHSANFLVAKHTRNLLCQVCQSQTPWTASGARLGPTVSVCNTCGENSSGEKQGRREGDDDETDVDECSVDEYSNEELSESGEESEDEDEDEDGRDNQVVPWSWSSMMPLPPSSSSSSREAVSSCLSSKRMRENTDLDSEDEIGSIALRFNHNIASMAPSSPALENDEASSLGYFRSMKFKRPNETI